MQRLEGESPSWVIYWDVAFVQVGFSSALMNRLVAVTTIAKSLLLSPAPFNVLENIRSVR